MSLKELQKKQRIHDENFHRDIYFLSHQERFKHITYHFGKYTGRMARLLKRFTDEKNAEEMRAELQKTLTDSFIIILNAAEIFGLNLEQAVSNQFKLQVTNEVSKLGNIIREQRPDIFPSLATSNEKELLLNLMLEYSDSSHTLHKACDSLDHMEGVDREKITSSLVNLLAIVVLAGHSLKLNFETNVPERWSEIERSKVL